MTLEAFHHVGSLLSSPTPLEAVRSFADRVCGARKVDCEIEIGDYSVIIGTGSGRWRRLPFPAAKDLGMSHERMIEELIQPLMGGEKCLLTPAAAQECALVSEPPKPIVGLVGSHCQLASEERTTC